MGRHHDQQTKTCGVEIIGVLALVLVGRALLEREGVNTLPTNKQHTAEGTLCSHKISEEEKTQIAKGVQEQIWTKNTLSEWFVK